MVWLDHQTSHNMPLKPKPDPEHGPTFFNSVKAERGVDAAEETEANKVGS